MKKILCLLLCSLMIAAVFGGCVSRTAQPEPSASTAQNEIAPDEERPAASEQEAEEVSSAPEKIYPLPELSVPDQTLLEEAIGAFIGYFPQEQTTATTDAIPPEEVLFFCLVQANRQKDLLGYYFEQMQQPSGDYFIIPPEVVSETAERLFGLTDFTYTDSSRYDAEREAYLYSTGHGSSIARTEVSEIIGAPDGGVRYDVSFFAPDGASEPAEGEGFDTPYYTLRYTCRVNRINGMPYLQLVSITTL